MRVSSMGGPQGYITVLQRGPLVLFHMGAPKVLRDPSVEGASISVHYSTGRDYTFNVKPDGRFVVRFGPLKAHIMLPKPVWK